MKQFFNSGDVQHDDNSKSTIFFEEKRYAPVPRIALTQSSTCTMHILISSAARIKFVAQGFWET